SVKSKVRSKLLISDLRLQTSMPRITTVHPQRAIEGGRITVEGDGFAIDGPALPEVRIGGAVARIVYASSTRLAVIVPPGLDAGAAPIRVGDAGASNPSETVSVEIAAPFATGLHQVDSPVFDRDGNLYVTYSGTRGQQVPVSIFRVRPNGT